MVYNCIICEEPKYGFGNNAMPVKDGLCCDDCNLQVIIARLKNNLDNFKGGKAETSNKTPTKTNK